MDEREYTRFFVQEAEQAAKAAKRGYQPTVDFHPDLIHGFCAKCKLVGGMTEGTAVKMGLKAMDRLMNGKSVTFPNPICPNTMPDGTRCLGREFIPLQLNEEEKTSMEILQKSQRNAVKILGQEG